MSQKVIRYYMPSNGSEGDFFIEKWCMNCACDNQYQSDVIIVQHGSVQCSIIDDSMLGNHVDQWRYGDDDKPMCTGFKRHDWEQGAPQSTTPNPNQLEIWDADACVIKKEMTLDEIKDEYGDIDGLE